MTTPESIAHIIRNLRRQMGLSQEKLASQLGVSFSTLNRWENGHTYPSPLAREKIERLLEHLAKQASDEPSSGIQSSSKSSFNPPKHDE